MNIVIAAKLMELYAACPNCGCEVIGNGDALECDTAVGYFKRSCGCGWCVEVTEGIVEEALAEDPPELPAKKCTHTYFARSLYYKGAGRRRKTEK